MCGVISAKWFVMSMYVSFKRHAPVAAAMNHPPPDAVLFLYEGKAPVVVKAVPKHVPQIVLPPAKLHQARVVAPPPRPARVVPPTVRGMPIPQSAALSAAREKVANIVPPWRLNCTLMRPPPPPRRPLTSNNNDGNDGEWDDTRRA